jgi:hypothetical protein
MKQKMSKKEQNEPVTKGFLQDYNEYLERKGYVTESSLEIILENKDYVTKDFLKKQDYVTKDFLKKQDYVTKDFLMKQDYVTKDWAMDMFRVFEKRISEDFTRQTNALVEIIRHENRLIVEALVHRIERVENYIGLPYP